MAKFIAELNQDGGCDYSIGCGIKIIALEAETWVEASNEAKDILREYRHDEHKLDSFTIYEVNETKSIPVNQIYDELDLEDQETRQAEYEAKQRLEYEALKKKFEK